MNNDNVATILGPHEDAFYCAIGQIICLSSVLENHVLALYQALTGSYQGEYTQLPLSSLAARATLIAERIPDADVRMRVIDYLARVRETIAPRADAAHNLWPVQDDGTLFGWRPSRDKSSADGTAMTVRLRDSDLQAQIAVLVGLIHDWQTIYALVSGGAIGAE